MKRYIAILLVFVLTLSALTACGSNTGTGKGPAEVKGKTAEEKVKAPEGKEKITETKEKTPEASEKKADTSLPIVKTPLTLTYWIAMDAKVSASLKEFGQVKTYEEMEKRTGINIKFMHPPMGQESEQFNLMIASSDLPDIVVYNWRTVPGGPAKAINDGTIIKLNDLIDKHAPHFKKIISEKPQIKKDMVMDDGTLYNFPVFRSAGAEVNATWGPQFRKDWLDKLNLQVPRTLEDWCNVYIAFRDKDPNGNGNKDEIPLTGNLGTLSQFTSAWGILDGFYMDNGKISYGPIQPVYKEFLTTMNQWYKEKLIDQDIITNDKKAIDSKITGSLAGSYFDLLIGGMGRFLDLMKPKDPTFDLKAAAWPIGPGGKSYTTQGINHTVGPGAAVSSKNKHVKETIQWLDYHYSPEGHMLINFGIEGKSYIMENGKPKYTDLIFKNPNGLTAIQSLAQWAIGAVTTGPQDMDRGYYDQLAVYPQQKDAAFNTWLKVDTSLPVPPISPTMEESQRMATIMNEINTYKQEMFAKFILGQEPVSNFEKFTQAIKGMGIEEVLKMQNAALDRYNKRK